MNKEEKIEVLKKIIARNLINAGGYTDTQYDQCIYTAAVSGMIFGLRYLVYRMTHVWRLNIWNGQATY